MRRLNYKEDYISYWNGKELYGKTRVSRMIARKRKRYEVWLERRRNRKYQPWWEDGRMIQLCEMGGTCEWPCNGDC